LIIAQHQKEPLPAAYLKECIRVNLEALPVLDAKQRSHFDTFRRQTRQQKVYLPPGAQHLTVYTFQGDRQGGDIYFIYHADPHFWWIFRESDVCLHEKYEPEEKPNLESVLSTLLSNQQTVEIIQTDTQTIYDVFSFVDPDFFST